MKPPILDKSAKKKFNKQNFFERVYEVVRKIPRGRVTSYGAIAQYLGTGLSARTVGWAMSSGLTSAKMPAHRVVNRNGLLTGKLHFATPTLMEDLLQSEGIKVIDNHVKNFSMHFWDPARELNEQKSKAKKSKQK